jgi:hypothetical protein
MSRERRTYTFVVVVEPAEDAWHAYCPTWLCQRTMAHFADECWPPSWTA